ncbi:hypothetical protein J7E22_07520 [Curtobacterium sp. ISL-83]|nr:hypothetical protein [Curtobacterium sp. ISL-83]
MTSVGGSSRLRVRVRHYQIEDPSSNRSHRYEAPH